MIAVLIACMVLMLLTGISIGRWWGGRVHTTKGLTKRIGVDNENLSDIW